MQMQLKFYFFLPLRSRQADSKICMEMLKELKLASTTLRSKIKLENLLGFEIYFRAVAMHDNLLLV